MTTTFNTKGIREFCKLLNEWDQYSDFSDDANVRRRGDQQWEVIKSHFLIDQRFLKVKDIFVTYCLEGRTPEGKVTATKAIDALLG